MKNCILLISILLASCFYTNAQDFYVKKWQQVEKLEVENKVEDAQTIIKQIYKHAKRKKDHDQLVKSFLFRAKFNLIKEENGQEKVLAELDELIDKAKFPKKNVYHSIYAKLLGDYVHQNRWNLQRRTAGGEMYQNDFKSWDIKKFYSVVSGHHQAALKNSKK
ncbi:hypothetical protein [Nonlabens sp.]|uniref:hypothetical protein n=1 Tax=Nonlabens sp. TaxID=1888209 RepID=UPI003F6A05E6